MYILVDLDSILRPSYTWQGPWGPDASIIAASVVSTTGLHYKFNQYSDPVIIVTYRPESLRSLTESQLRQYGVRYDRLIMRPDYDSSYSWLSSAIRCNYPAQSVKYTVASNSCMSSALRSCGYNVQSNL